LAGGSAGAALNWPRAGGYFQNLGQRRGWRGTFGRFDGTNPIFRNWRFFFWLRGWFGGGALLLEAAELGQRPEVPAVFRGETALNLLQESVGGRIAEQGQQIGSGIEELGFQAAPALFVPLGEEREMALPQGRFFRDRKAREQGQRVGARNMASLERSQCPAVESVPGKRNGAWVFKDTRMPVATCSKVWKT